MVERSLIVTRKFLSELTSSHLRTCSKIVVSKLLAINDLLLVVISSEFISCCLNDLVCIVG